MARRPLALGVIAVVMAAVAGCSADAGPQALSQPPPPPASPTAVVTEGIDSIEDVTIGPTTTDSVGQPIAELAVTNRTPNNHDYTVTVAFRTVAGDTLDTAVVSVLGVASQSQVRATVHSMRRASSSTVVVTRAIRNCPAP